MEYSPNMKEDLDWLLEEFVRLTYAVESEFGFTGDGSEDRLERARQIIETMKRNLAA